MRTAIREIIDTLGAEDPKIYIRYTDWRDQVEDAINNRIGLRVSTHAVYNNYKEIDDMFERLVVAVDASGLPQL